MSFECQTKRVKTRWGLLLAGVALLLSVEHARAQRIHRETFESTETSFSLGLTDDGQARLLDHGLTAQLAHSGRQAERFVVRLTSGTFCLLEYPVPHALVFDDLVVSAWVYASRPGVKLQVRVVLPKENDEQTGKAMVTLLAGDSCEVANRWQRLMVRTPQLAMHKQRQLLQAQRKRKIDVRGAYIDMMALDIHCGIGDVEVLVDDIHIGPVVVAPETAPAFSEEPVPVNLRDDEGRQPQIQRPQIANQQEKNNAVVVGSELRVGDRPFFIRGIRRTEAPLETLRDAHFNTLFVDWPIDAGFASEAHRLGFRWVPMLPIVNRQAPVTTTVSPERGDFQEEALIYFVGGDLDPSAEPTVKASIANVRAADPSLIRPMTGDASWGLRSYSRTLDLVGAYRYPLGSSLQLTDYGRWLAQRRDIARPGTLFWTWIQTHLPDSYTELVYADGHTRASSCQSDRFRNRFGF